MTSSISWIDHGGLEAILRRMGFRGRRPPAATVEAAAAEPTASPPAAEARAIADFRPPAGALRQRLEAFMTWVVQEGGASVAFLVDRDGLPLVNRGADPDLLAVAASVMRPLESIDSELLLPVGRTVSLELAAGQLRLVAVDTSIGRYIVGHVAAGPLGAGLCAATAAALRRALEPSAEAKTYG
ncbi:MAG: hypothetical protein OES32_09385 [Acidobacteriota bacterium]|nr:hypothetical protein [Acidobacteriota bacterium]